MTPEDIINETVAALADTTDPERQVALAGVHALPAHTPRARTLIAMASALGLALVIVGLTFVLHLLNNTPPQCEYGPRPTVNCITVFGPGGDGPGPMIGGTVTSSPAGINCPPTCSATFKRHTSVTLIATPSSGWVFTGWSSTVLNPRTDCYGTTGSCPVWMDDNIYFWAADFRQQ